MPRAPQPIAPASLPTARADDTEHREFSIFVDGKQAGSSKMTLVQKDDGSTFMSAAIFVIARSSESFSAMTMTFLPSFRPSIAIRMYAASL